MRKRLPVGQIVPVQASNIPLWQAIILGSGMKPPTREGWEEGSPSVVTATCAMSAAVDAVMDVNSITPGNTVVVTELFPILLTKASCPLCAMSDDMYNIVMHLHDDHNWTRICTAFWIKGIESPEVTTEEFQTVVARVPEKKRERV